MLVLEDEGVGCLSARASTKPRVPGSKKDAVLAKKIGDDLWQLAIAIVDALAVHRDELDVCAAAASPHAPKSSHVVVIHVRKLRGRAVVDVEH